MRVLLPLDGSENSVNASSAIPYLADCEEVLLVHALDFPHVPYPMGRPEVELAIPESVKDSLRDEATKLLTTTEPQVSGGRKASRHIGEGAPGQVILDVADREGVDLIVIGARGLSGLKELALGSVSTQVVPHAHCPVLVVKDRMHRLSRVLLPIQNADDADLALHYLRKHPFVENPQITVLHVLPFHEPLWPGGLSDAQDHLDMAEAQTHDFLADVVKELLELKYPAEAKVLTGRPATAIHEVLDEGEFDLVIMGSRGRAGLKRVLLGSVSYSVVHHTRAPVLVLR